MAGLLAGNMLRQYSPAILERQSELPHNHSALLRFRSPVVGDVLNIPFKKVRMIKAIAPWLNPISDALSYSKKNTEMFRTDRSIIEGIVSEDRYIAPLDLIELMARGLHITYNINYDPKKVHPEHYTISTMPMPALMNLLEYPGMRPDFSYSSGMNVTARILDCDAYCSILVPAPSYPFSRISITGDQLIIECPRHERTEDAVPIFKMATRILGSYEMNMSFTDLKATPQKYSKINPIDDNARKAFIHWASVERGIYSLGRFATWRPGLLLDDLVKDIRLISGWIQSGHNYDLKKHGG